MRIRPLLFVCINLFLSYMVFYFSITQFQVRILLHAWHISLSHVHLNSHTHLLSYEHAPNTYNIHSIYFFSQTLTYFLSYVHSLSYLNCIHSLSHMFFLHTWILTLSLIGMRLSFTLTWLSTLVCLFPYPSSCTHVLYLPLLPIHATSLFSLGCVPSRAI
jgi:hypothetical protein